MFNLLVSAAGWKPDRNSVDHGRTFEYTGADLEARFKPNGTLDVEAIKELPALFMQETWHDNSQQPARVATITRVTMGRAKYDLEYRFDPDISPIPNSELKKFAGALDIADFEFNRTHWALKHADLFRVLLLNEAGKPISPKVFALSQGAEQDNLISVMMPFDPRYDNVYASLQQVAADLGKQCQRADDIWKHDAIVQDIVHLICTSSIVIADLTGKNANVFYETGIAHTIGKNVIFITQSDNDVPFDLRHLRFVQYLPNGEGLRDLQAKVKQRIETLDKQR